MLLQLVGVSKNWSREKTKNAAQKVPLQIIVFASPAYCSVVRVVSYTRFLSPCTAFEPHALTSTRANSQGKGKSSQLQKLSLIHAVVWMTQRNRSRFYSSDIPQSGKIVGVIDLRTQIFAAALDANPELDELEQKRLSGELFAKDLLKFLTGLGKGRETSTGQDAVTEVERMLDYAKFVTLSDWNLLIFELEKAGRIEAAEKLLQRLLSDPLKKTPSALTFHPFFRQFSRVGNVEKLKYYWKLIKENGVEPDARVLTSLQLGYLRARNYVAAASVVPEMLAAKVHPEAGHIDITLFKLFAARKFDEALKLWLLVQGFKLPHSIQS